MQEWWTRLRTQVGGIVGGMSKAQRWGAGVLTLVVLAGLLYLGWRTANPEFAPLFTRLSPSDASEIVSALRDAGIPYRLVDGGTTVLVPEEQVYDVRLGLAGQGLPRGGVVGFEIFLETALGATDFDRQVRYNMALQGELTRTIRELDAVQDARVHIVIPERRLFARDERPPTASVFLQLRPGAQLTASQIRGIAHLVARSVEGLEPENVTIVDNRGQVLSDFLRTAALAESMDSAGVAARLELQRAYERELELRVQTMLETVYGPGRAIVRVNAVMNFDREEQREDRYEPVVRDQGVVRSSQVVEEQATGAQAVAAGVVGVDANIPGYVADDGQAGSYSRREEILNFELNRVERVRIQAPGGVERLSVAVWLDAQLSAAETQRVQELVSAALGVDTARGDTVIVDSMPFAASAALPVVAPEQAPAAVPLWLIAAAVIVVLAGGILLARRRRPVPAPIVLPVSESAAAVEESPEPEVAERRRLRERISALVRDNPREAANLVRVWLAED
ncbi:MAG: flagellar M-ring protein FliF [Firmicutes bacterium ZCTH02-B6]|nr:MAG: flagellar M-ring protein FliF [Firmicutes bacterium ZCTH02-B6]